MSVLMFALGIYIVGVAIVLYLRPSIMFRSGGWKEFGLANTGNYTVFPFWMFTVLWAFLSYVLATMATVFFSSLALKSSPNMSNNFNIQPISSVAVPATPTVSASLAPASLAPASLAPTPAPVTPTMSASAPPARAPGYYILTPSPTQQPQYVYYGTTPPSFEDIAAVSRQ